MADFLLLVLSNSDEIDRTCKKLKVNQDMNALMTKMTSLSIKTPKPDQDQKIEEEPQNNPKAAKSGSLFAQGDPQSTPNSFFSGKEQIKSLWDADEDSKLNGTLCLRRVSDQAMESLRRRQRMGIIKKSRNRALGKKVGAGGEGEGSGQIEGKNGKSYLLINKDGTTEVLKTADFDQKKRKRNNPFLRHFYPKN